MQQAAVPMPVAAVDVGVRAGVVLGVKRRGSATTGVPRKRQRRQRWTLPELQWCRSYLQEDQTTVRKWVSMKHAGQSVLLPTRTGVDLKDCARTMQRGGYTRQGVLPF